MAMAEFVKSPEAPEGELNLDSPFGRFTVPADGPFHTDDLGLIADLDVHPFFKRVPDAEATPVVEQPAPAEEQPAPADLPQSDPASVAAVDEAAPAVEEVR